MALEEATWEQLDQELEQWRRDRRQATLWWRDDDAVAFSPQLAHLCGLAAAHWSWPAFTSDPERSSARLAW